MADFKIKSAAGTGNKTLIQSQEQSGSNYAIEIGDGGALKLGTITSGTFPAGHIIKTSSVFYDNSATQVVISADATWTEIHSGLRLTHTAESASNILLMTFSTAFCSPNANNLYGAKFYNQSGSADITIPSLYLISSLCFSAKSNPPLVSATPCLTKLTIKFLPIAFITNS